MVPDPNRDDRGMLVPERFSSQGQETGLKGSVRRAGARLPLPAARKCRAAGYLHTRSFERVLSFLILQNGFYQQTSSDTHSAVFRFSILYRGCWRRKWHPTPVLLTGKSHGQRSIVDYSPWGRKESDTTERLHFTSLHFMEAAEVYSTESFKKKIQIHHIVKPV